MQRILAAAFIAVTFHAVIFTCNPDWLKGKRSFIKRPPAITVTMSYKKPPAPPPPAKKIVQEISKKEVVRPEKINKAPGPAKVEEKVDESVTTAEQGAGIEKDIINDASSDNEIAENRGSVTEEKVPEIITEAEPLYRVNPEPSYPKMARKRGYQGTVILSVLVNREGRVDNLWVFESSGYNILDNAALEAVKEWLFEPGKQGDKPVDMWVEVPVRFEIR